MRTTLKKGTRAGSNGNGSRPRDFGAFTSPPLGPVKPVRGMAPQPVADRRQDPRLARDRPRHRRRRSRRRGVALPQRVGQRRSGEVRGGEADGGIPRRSRARAADRGHRHRVRHAQGRGGESGRALGHDHAAPRRPVERHAVDALIPARPRGRASRAARRIPSRGSTASTPPSPSAARRGRCGRSSSSRPSRSTTSSPSTSAASSRS